MPKSSHIHKSMLLRGVEFAKPALTQSDIEVTKSKAARSGRAHGGVPLQGDGRARNSFNYSNQSQNGNQQRGSRNGYNNQNGHNNQNQFPVPPPGWQPPPPGMAGFARGPPPPPPPGTYGSWPPAPHQYSQPPATYGYTKPRQGPPGNGEFNDRRRGGDYRGDSYRGQRDDSYRGNQGQYRGR
ncbi:uncharacterized protein LY89DRAFT_165027 [Mollisia scopiformis]|uniref:Uncharacterized protein n=1 Tax=Mollisia scopiformis TaxID=149040 RepID=A0A194XS61_MOLSC|nr:uncharacterized protein LY89DRAFT_165027 [Mollisia scopiformis]KUJ23033.1 hypothetical protein LY89DRAFT_165027 [Mollisia scopiformis]